MHHPEKCPDAFRMHTIVREIQDLCHLIYGANSFACFIAIYNDHCPSSSTFHRILYSRWNVTRIKGNKTENM